MLAMWTVIAVVLVGCLCPCNGDQWNVVIYPDVQKVPEYGHVVFTCVSSRPNVVFKWTVPKAGEAKDSTEGEIMNERDDIRIVQTASNMSALVIEKALIKKHKRKYRCLAVEPESGVTQPSEKDVFLKITPMSRLHKHFPHLMAIRTAEDVLLPAREPNTMDMQCRTLVPDQTRDGLKWTWVKDGYMDLSLNDSGKYQIHPDGRLHITKLTGADSGTYTCVASNNRGTSYGSPVRVNVTSSALEGKCLLQNGDILDVGEKYQLDGDPCNTCTCEEENRVTCRMVRCVPPYCNGRGYIKSNDSCCEFTCIDDTQEMCIDRDGNKVSHGEFYMPEEDPCLSCICINGNKGRCMMVACDAPKCSDFVRSRDVCCNYTCKDVPEPLSEPDDFNFGTPPLHCVNRKRELVPHGEIYNPDQDPCVQCTCKNGTRHLCMSVSCKPRCTNYTIIPDTCCEYTCNENQAACYDNKGKMHPHGSIFIPGDDPCETCKCENGQTTACANVACYPPPCKDFELIPGKCCEFVCHNESWSLKLNSTPKTPTFNVLKSCVDRKGKMIKHGEKYNPDVDACVKCTCNNGSRHRCMSVSCIPPCKNYTIVPDKCCEFTCNENQAACYDKKGNMHPHDSTFTPGDDACVTCKCENGQTTACATVSCYPPPCKDFEMIPGKCCEFVCRDVSVVPKFNSTKRPCYDSDGTEYRHGDIFTLSENPCKECKCENGKQVGCIEIYCDAPPCPEYVLIPGTCCGFVCHGQPGPVNIENERIERTAFIRQIGSREVLVQWQIPDESSHNSTNTTVWLTEGSFRSGVNVLKGRDWTILSDLDPNKIYKVEVKVATGHQLLKTPPVSFMVDDKAKSNLKLADAIGEVYESRGALDYGSYSLPRMFNRVLLDETANVTINVAAFHRVDTTYLEQSPCRQDMCGVIRFYMYTMEGNPINVMSLMFNDNKDFEWAKCHL